MGFVLGNKNYNKEIYDFNDKQEVLYIEESNENNNLLNKTKEKKSFFPFKKDNYSSKSDS